MPRTGFQQDLPFDFTGNSIEVDWPVMTTKTGMKNWKINWKLLNSLNKWADMNLTKLTKIKVKTFNGIGRREEQEFS